MANSSPSKNSARESAEKARASATSTIQKIIDDVSLGINETINDLRDDVAEASDEEFGLRDLASTALGELREKLDIPAGPVDELIDFLAGGIEESGRQLGVVDPREAATEGVARIISAIETLRTEGVIEALECVAGFWVATWRSTIGSFRTVATPIITQERCGRDGEEPEEPAPGELRPPNPVPRPQIPETFPCDGWWVIHCHSTWGWLPRYRANGAGNGIALYLGGQEINVTATMRQPEEYGKKYEIRLFSHVQHSFGLGCWITFRHRFKSFGSPTFPGTEASEIDGNGEYFGYSTEYSKNYYAFFRVKDGKVETLPRNACPSGSWLTSSPSTPNFGGFSSIIIYNLFDEQDVEEFLSETQQMPVMETGGFKDGNPVFYCPQYYEFVWVADRPDNVACTITPPPRQQPTTLQPPRRMQEDCCRLQAALLRKIAVAVGANPGEDGEGAPLGSLFPGTLPSSILERNGDEPSGTKTVNNLPDLLIHLAKLDDERWGKWEVVAQAKDSDFTQEGDQPAEMRLPNLAEAIGEFQVQLFLIEAYLKLLVSLSMTNNIETALTKQESVKSLRAIETALEYLGIDGGENMIEVPFMSTINKKKYSEFLEPSTIKIPVHDWDDEKTLQDTLKDLLQAAAIVRAMHWVPVNPRDQSSIKSQLTQLVRDFTNVASPDTPGPQTDDEQQQEQRKNWDDFVEDVEDGFRYIAQDPENPYGRTFDRRPRILEKGSDNQDVGG